MTRRAPMAGATLFYSPDAARPDLVAVLQFLLDDLRAAGAAPTSVRLTASGLRLRFGQMDLALSVSEGPLPLSALAGVRRLVRTNGAVDSAAGRVRVTLVRHQRAIGLLLRWRRAGNGPEPTLLADALHRIIAALSEVAPPAVVLWQTSALILTRDEFLTWAPAHLDQPGDSAPLAPCATRRARPARPASEPRVLPATPAAGDPAPDAQATPPLAVTSAPPPPVSRRARRTGQSAGRLFGTGRFQGGAGAALAPVGAQAAGLLRALRAPVTNPAPGPARNLGRIAALAAYFALILPPLPV